METPPQPQPESDGGWADVTTDGGAQAIEAARAAASHERRKRRALLAHYVALGFEPGDAEAVIEFEAMWQQQANAPPNDSAAEQSNQETET